MNSTIPFLRHMPHCFVYRVLVEFMMRFCVQYYSMFSIFQVRLVLPVFRRSRRCIHSIPKFESPEIERLERRVDRYKRLLGALSLPHGNHFTLNGRKFGPLPYHLEETPLIDTNDGIPEDHLHYLAGCFSVRGSITLLTRCRGYRFDVYGSHAHPELCYEFLRAFGGVICRAKPFAYGMQTSSVSWMVSKQSRIRAIADLLLSLPSTKSNKLRTILEWPKHKDFASRKEASLAFKSLSRCEDHGPITSVAFLAGLFDASGSLNIPGIHSCNTCHILFSMANRSNLQYIHQLLVDRGIVALDNLHIHRRNRSVEDHFTLYYYSRADTVNIFQLMRPYLRRMAARADLILNNDPSPHVRQALQECSISVGVFDRCDAEGFALSRHVRLLRRRQRRRPFGSDEFQEELQKALREREILRLTRKSEKMKSALHNLLSRGATVVRPS